MEEYKSTVEWLKAIHDGEIKYDPRFPLYNFACFDSELEEVEAFVKEHYRTYSKEKIMLNTGFGYQFSVDLNQKIK